MDSLIDKVRQGLECHKDEIPGVCGKCPYFTETGFCSGQLAKDALKVLDSRDAMLVVRCKDCQNLGYTNSHWFCKWLNRCVDEDFFCGDGVKRK